MEQKITVAPSILAANLGRLEEEITDVEKAGADWLHIDVMDGSFVPPITFGTNIVSFTKSITGLFLDVHLMINEPDKHLSAFKEAGSDCITVHQETCPHLYRVLASIQAMGILSGVSVNPGTPIESVFNVLDVCNLVLNIIRCLPG